VSRFSAEPDKWFRAKVLEVLEDDKVKVQFVDYGNVDTVSSSEVSCGLFNSIISYLI
jgi:Tudor domain